MQIKPTETWYLFFFGPKLWNCLPLNIRNSQYVYSFKRHNKSILIGNCVSVISIIVLSSVLYVHDFDQLLDITSSNFQVVFT